MIFFFTSLTKLTQCKINFFSQYEFTSILTHFNTNLTTIHQRAYLISKTEIAFNTEILMSQRNHQLMINKININY
jgi:hypothetical protein